MGCIRAHPASHGHGTPVPGQPLHNDPACGVGPQGPSVGGWGGPRDHERDGPPQSWLAGHAVQYPKEVTEGES